MRTRVGGSWGIPWIYPRDRARRKVEREGEPKQRKVGYEAGLGKTAEGEECSVRGGRGNGDGRYGEEPEVGRGRLGAGEEGKRGGGRLKDRDRSGSEDG